MPNNKNQMKPKLITSIVFGILVPWLYFVVVTVGPARHVGTEGKSNIGSSGISGFIEFHGIIGATEMYIKTALLCAGFVYIICTAYTYIEAHYATKA